MTKTAVPLTTEGDAISPLPAPTRANLEKQRKEHPVFRGPSGATYQLRKVNLERHALSGGLPTNLRRAAMEGVKGLEKLLDSELAPDEGGSSETRDYLDSLVLATVVAPKLTADDLGAGTLDDDPLLPAVDYAWLVKVAMNEAEYDADGRRLWGLEPLDRFATFRAFHGCDADCEGCQGFRAAVSAVIERGRDAA